VRVQAGECGNQIKEQSWEAALDEHGIDRSDSCHSDSDRRLEQINVCDSKATGGEYLTGATFVGLDPGTMDSVRADRCGQLFRPSSSRSLIGREKQLGNKMTTLKAKGCAN
jgi:tubulin beta